jgi:hypothetical protein
VEITSRNAALSVVGSRVLTVPQLSVVGGIILHWRTRPESNLRTGPRSEESPTVILNLAEAVRISMNAVEAISVVGGAFLVGFLFALWFCSK